LTAPASACISNVSKSAAPATADLEIMMTFIRLSAGWRFVVCGALAAGLLILAPTLGYAAEAFPFDQELVLDAEPMRPAKRMPVLNVEPNGNAKIDLWCKTVVAHVELSDAGVKIESEPLPEALPEMMGNGQCSPERMQADQDLLAALTQVTEWRLQGSALVLGGPTPLKFRPSDH
jgi:heat shock protein HslJ